MSDWADQTRVTHLYTVSLTYHRRTTSDRMACKFKPMSWENPHIRRHESIDVFHILFDHPFPETRQTLTPSRCKVCAKKTKRKIRESE